MSTNQVLTKAKMLSARGEFEKAEQLIGSILMQYPKNKSAKKQLVHLARKRAKHNPAGIEEQTKQLLKLSHQFNKDNYQEAVELSESLKLLYPEKFIVWFINAISKSRTGNIIEAFSSFERALEINPRHAELHFEIGQAFEKNGDHKNAIKSYFRSEKLNGKDARPFNAIGILYQKARKYEDALEYFLQAIKADPKSADAHNNAALINIDIAEFDQSCKYIEKALALDPKIPEFYFNQAYAEFKRGNLEKALNIHRKGADLAAIDTHTENLVTIYSFNEALIALSLGKLESAWKTYQRRFESKNFPSHLREFDMPRLRTLEEAKGKTILLWAEQGLGDELMFLNLAKYFKQTTGCKFIIEPSYRLISLLSRSFEKDTVLRAEKDNETEKLTTSAKIFDFHMPFGDLPCLLNFMPGATKKVMPYLKADEKLTLSWENKIPKNKIRIGFSWRSQNTEGVRKFGYTQLEQWRDLINNENFILICLQYGDISEDLNPLDKDLKEKIYFPDVDLTNDLENVAAIMNTCDLIISPGNAVLQQAAAMGVKTLTYSGPIGPYYMGVKREKHKASPHPFLNNNLSICYHKGENHLIPKLIENELFKLYGK